MNCSGDGLDLVREAVCYVMQELIETEATEVVGTRCYERNEHRSNERNGHRTRILSTKYGTSPSGSRSSAAAASFLPCSSRAYESPHVVGFLGRSTMR